jgi:hypothetical protein
MPHHPLWRSRLIRCEHAAVYLLLIVAATLSAPPISRAAEPAAAAETSPAGAGPLTPVRREPPAASAQSAPSSKQAPAAKKPAIAMPRPDSTTPASTPSAAATPPAPALKAAKPQPKQAEEATPPRPHRKTPPTKTTSMAIEQPDKKASPAERRSRSTEVVEQTQRRERVYPGAYGWPEDEPFAYRGGRPYVPPPVYGEVPGEMGPVPFAPPWSYRNRSFAWGPYPGMGGPRGPW